MRYLANIDCSPNVRYLVNMDSSPNVRYLAKMDYSSPNVRYLVKMDSSSNIRYWANMDSSLGMSLGRGPAQPGLARALHETIFKVGLSRARPIYFGPI